MLVQVFKDKAHFLATPPKERAWTQRRVKAGWIGEDIPSGYVFTGINPSFPGRGPQLYIAGSRRCTTLDRVGRLRPDETYFTDVVVYWKPALILDPQGTGQVGDWPSGSRGIPRFASAADFLLHDFGRPAPARLYTVADEVGNHSTRAISPRMVFSGTPRAIPWGVFYLAGLSGQFVRLAWPDEVNPDLLPMDYSAAVRKPPEIPFVVYPQACLILDPWEGR